MKNLLLILAILVSTKHSSAQITFQGCTSSALGAQNYTLNSTGTTNDAGTIRNTFESTPANFMQSCPAGVCEIRMIWSITNSRWEVQLDNDGPVNNPDYTTACLYFNTSPSAPNPPDLSLGTWQDCSGGSCPTGELTTLSGDVQSSISSCSNPSIPSIVASPTSICEGNTSTLTITGTLNDATAWHIYSGSCGGTALGSTTGNTFVVTPNVSSNTFYIRGEDGTGCVDESTGSCGSVSVTVNPTPPTPAISANGPTTFCNGSSVQLTSSANTGNQWYLNGAPISNANNQNYTATTAGNYTVISTINGCPSASSTTLSVTVNSPAMFSQTLVQCAGTSITVGTSTYMSSGNYSDTLVASNNCDSIVSTDLTILPALGSTLNQTICAGGSITVNGTIYNSSVTGATEVFPNIGPNNCDSTVTINLTVLNPIDTSVSTTYPSLTANLNATSYQWVNCDSSYAIINGANNQSYSPANSGNYAVIITDGNCTDTSSCHAIIITSIENNKLNKMLTVFPNPTSGNLGIEFGQMLSQIQIKITTVSGQHIATKTFESTDKIDLTIEGDSGVYFLEISTDTGESTTLKILKK